VLLSKHDLGYHNQVEEAHERDAVHPVGKATMSWQHVREVFDSISAFEPTQHETEERRDNRCKRTVEKAVELSLTQRDLVQGCGKGQFIRLLQPERCYLAGIMRKEGSSKLERRACKNLTFM
jgi:hypothetical protein